MYTTPPKEKDKFYTSGPACFRGHENLRYISTGQCYHCMRLRYRENKDSHREDMRKNYFELGGRESRQERDRLNSEKIRAQKARWRKENPEMVREQKRRSYERNKSKILDRCKEYRKTESGKQSRRKERENLKINKPWVIAARSCLNNLIRRQGGLKKSKSEDILGYGFDQFKKRIEFNFEPGMSWCNYGDWHVDHTKPVSRFSEQGIKDPKVINCLANLRPMWAKENIRKGSKWQSMK